VVSSFVPTASWLGQRVNLREVKARAAVRARVGAYSILDSVSPARARLQIPLEHVDGAQSKRATTHRAEQIPPSGRLGPSQKAKVLFSNNNTTSQHFI
jgi:hypothetical protein